jgi:hypothetical protein
MLITKKLGKSIGRLMKMPTLNLPAFFVLTLEKGVVYFITVCNFLYAATSIPLGKWHVYVKRRYCQAETGKCGSRALSVMRRDGFSMNARGNEPRKWIVLCFHNILVLKFMRGAADGYEACVLRGH